MIFCGYIGQLTIFSRMLTTECRLVVGSALGSELVSGWIVVIYTHIYNTFHCYCHFPYTSILWGWSS